MSAPKPEIIDALSFASNRPEIPTAYQERDDHVELINSYLRQDISTVCVVGPQQFGKSCLLYEFARQHYEDTIGVFFTGVAGYSFSPSYIRYELYSQLDWILNGNPPEPSNNPSDADVEQLFMLAQRKLQNNREPLKIIIDGIYEGESRSAQALETVKRLIPIGAKEFRMLISAQTEAQVKPLLPYSDYRRIDLPPLPKRAANRLLEDLIEDDALRTDLIRSCRSEPGKLSTLRRILASTTDAEALASNLTDHVTDLFDYEWDKHEPPTEPVKSAIALLAFQPGNTDFDAIVRRASCNPGHLTSYIAQSPFLEISDNGAITFISDSYRLYAKRRLSEFELDAQERVINDLQERPESEEALNDMPRHFAEAGRDHELFEWLTSERLFQITRSVNSLYAANSQLDLGISKGAIARDLSTALELTTRRSLLTDIPTSSILRAELRAALSLGELTLAHRLLASTKLKEDKLELVAIAASDIATKGTDPKLLAALTEELNALAAAIQPETLSLKRAAEIARAIFPVDSEVAINFVKNANSAQPQEQDVEEMFRFSVSTLGRNDKVGRKDALKQLKDAMPDSTHPNVDAASALFSASESIDEFIEELSNLDDKHDALTIAEFWCTTHADSSDSLPVIKFAVETALTVTSFNPTCAFYSSVLKPLKNSDNWSEVQKLISIVDTQSDVLKAYGPTFDFCAYQLSLAQAQFSADAEHAKERIFDLYLETVSTLYDASVRSSCLAQIADTIYELRANDKFEKEDQFLTLIWDDLEAAITTTLNETAAQEEALKRTFEVLSNNHLDYAVSLASRLNTLDRRDHSSSEILHAHLDRLYRPDFEAVEKHLGSIHSRFLKDEVRLHASYALIKHRADWAAQRPDVLNWISQSKEIVAVETKTEALAKLLSYAIEQGYLQESEQEDLKREVNIALDRIDIYWTKLRYAFSLVDWFSKSDENLAKQFLSRAIELRSESDFEVFDVSRSVMLALQLAIQAVPLLADDQQALTRAVHKISIEILRIPSYGLQAIIFAELSLLLSLNHRPEIAASVLSKNVFPSLITLERTNLATYEVVGMRICPALWYAHRTTFNEVLHQLSPRSKDSALLALTRTILRQLPPSAPYSKYTDNYPALDYSVIKDLIHIAQHAESDNTLYSVLSDVCKTIERSRSKRKLNNNQIPRLISDIRAVAYAKLPTPQYISHQGYLLAIEAAIGSISRGKYVDWNKLEASARAIPNIADRTYVLTLIAESLPGKKSAEAKELLADVEALIENVSCSYDKLTRYETLVQSAWRLDSSLSKRALKAAFALSNGSGDPEVEERRRALIDLADRISPDLPDQLIEALDDDPARKHEQVRLKERVELLKDSDDIAKTGLASEWLAKKTNRAIANICWHHLAAVNAERRIPVGPNRLIELVSAASKSRLNDVYPVFSLAIRSLVLRNSDGKRDVDFLGFDFIESITESAALLSSVLALSAGRENAWSSYSSKESKNDASTNGMVHPGERDKGENLIRGWITDHKPTFLRIIDPYFTLEDLELVHLVHQICPQCGIEIITSEEAQRKANVQEPWRESYISYWRRVFADTVPPDCVIAILGFGSQGKSPIHDRWWLADECGLRIGTSMNGLGGSRLSEVSYLAKDEAREMQSHIESYLNRRIKVIDGQPIRRYIFTLE